LFFLILSNQDGEHTEGYDQNDFNADREEGTCSGIGGRCGAWRGRRCRSGIDSRAESTVRAVATQSGLVSWLAAAIIAQCGVIIVALVVHGVDIEVLGAVVHKAVLALKVFCGDMDCVIGWITGACTASAAEVGTAIVSTVVPGLYACITIHIDEPIVVSTPARVA
jgi:hypothetical protein